jgi:hypothetical protein
VKGLIWQQPSESKNPSQDDVIKQEVLSKGIKSFWNGISSVSKAALSIDI